jgi:hypothetical protein
MCRMATSPAQCSFAFALLAVTVVGCGSSSGNKDVGPRSTDGSSIANDVGNGAKTDASRDLATESTADVLLAAPDVTSADLSFTSEYGPVVISDARDEIPDASDSPLASPDTPPANLLDAADSGPTLMVDGADVDSGPQPRVLIIDPETNRFLTYDRDGQLVHDYLAALDFGADNSNRHIWADGTLVSSRAFLSALDSSTHGLNNPARASRIVAWAPSTTAPQTAVKVLAVDGSVLADLTLPGLFWDVRVSPLQTLVFAADATEQAIVARISDNVTLWQGSVYAGAFARDDTHFVSFPRGCDSPVHIVDLASRKDTSVPVPFSCGRRLSGVAPPGAVFAADLAYDGGVGSFGISLFVDWQGKVSLFDSGPYSSARFIKFDPQGSAALWDGSTGRSQFDLTSLASQPWTGSDDSCFGRPDYAYLKRQGQALQSCRCSDRTCSLVVTLPVPPQPTTPLGNWYQAPQLSFDGHYVFVGYDWVHLPSSDADIYVQLYRSTGELLLTLPPPSDITPVQMLFDQTGQLAVLTSPAPVSWKEEVWIVNLSSLQVTKLPEATAFAIVYE